LGDERIGDDVRKRRGFANSRVIKTCSECTGAVKVIACIEDPKVIRQILDHLRQKAQTREFFVFP